MPENGVKKRAPYDWRSVNWELSLDELERVTGQPRGNIIKARARLARHKVNVGRRLPYDWSSVDWSLTTSEIVEQTGQEQSNVSWARRRYAPETVGATRAKGGRTVWESIDWWEERDDEQLANSMGCAVSTVEGWRKKLAPDTILVPRQYTPFLKKLYGYWDDEPL